MRFPLIAGTMAALSGAVDFEDDDLNILTRMLSSNASGNTTVAPTTAAPNTTAAPANTTVAPTTTVAAGNTTAAPVTTVANTTESPATTTESPTTTAVSIDSICSAAAYESVGLVAPSDLTEPDGTKKLWTKCSIETGLNVNDDTKYFTYGSSADTVDNKAVCTGTNSNAQATSLTCEGALAWWNGDADNSDDRKKAVLQYCCGASPSYVPKTLASILTTGGALTVGMYTDSECTTAASLTGRTGKSAYEFSSLGVETWETSFNLGECQSPSGNVWQEGAAWKIAGCNGTLSTTGSFIFNNYLDASCENMFDSSVVDKVNCVLDPDDSRRRLNGNGTSSALYVKHSCEGSAPTRKQFKTTLNVGFAGLPATMSSDDKTKFKGVYQAKAKETFTDAVANPAAVITEDHTYTGVLAGSRRRALAAKRRLQTGVATASSVFTTSLPAADAVTAAAAVTAATAGGSATLSEAAFKSTIETELKENPDTQTIAANVTATVQPLDVGEPVPEPEPSPGGTSTSAASESASVFGFASAIVLATAMLF